MVLVDQTEVVPTQAQVKGQLGSYFPIIVKVSTVVVLSVVGQRNIRDTHRGSTPNVVDAIGYRCCGRSQEEMGPARVSSPHVWNVRIAAAKIKFSARPGRLQRGELHMLELEAHFESMLAVNFSEIVIDLDCGSDFVRRQKGVAPQSLQPVDSKGRKTAVFCRFWRLRNALNAKL